MKRIALLGFIFVGFVAQTTAQSNLKAHYEAYYKQMKAQGDVNGIIGALTHLNVLEPNTARRDTLAFVYSNNGQYMQALNLLGVEKNTADSDLAVQVKAISLKAISQPKRAAEQFELLYTRNPNPYLAYELADLKIITGDVAGAETLITYGLANATDEMKRAFYERQQPYEVELKAAFLHLKALALFNTDKNKVDEAIGLIDQALTLSPNFNLASLSKQALEKRKEESQKTGQ